MRRTRQRVTWNWPSWRYSQTGEAKIFQCEADVPPGWTKKPGEVYVPVAGPVRYDRDDLISQLKSREIPIDPTWGVSHMKKVLDSDSSTPR